MKRYHGTNVKYSEDLCNGQIDPSRGGGELGQGFYVGNLAHQAYSWAWHNYKKNYCVIEFDIDDKQFQHLKIKWLNKSWATRKWRELQRTNQEGTYTFGVDVVWSHLLGGNISNMYQVKFEDTLNAKLFINNAKNKIL